MRKEGFVARALQAWVMIYRHMEEAYCCLSAQVSFHLPTNISTELIEAANEALDHLCEPGSA